MTVFSKTLGKVVISLFLRTVVEARLGGKEFWLKISLLSGGFQLQNSFRPRQKN
jgi:hypothetical protein